MQAGMHAERSKVLEMLAAGTITVEQATQLLDAIGWGGPPPAEGRTPQAREGNAGAAGVADAAGAGDVSGRRPGRTPAFSTAELIELSNQGVSPTFVRELWAAGFRDFTVDQLTELSNHGVTVDYLRELAAAGLSHLTVDEVVELANHGVRPSYVRELREAAQQELSLDEVVELSNHGVTPAYLREMGSALALATADRPRTPPAAGDEASTAGEADAAPELGARRAAGEAEG
jgi:hypothetical protein